MTGIIIIIVWLSDLSKNEWLQYTIIRFLMVFIHNTGREMNNELTFVIYRHLTQYRPYPMLPFHCVKIDVMGTAWIIITNYKNTTSQDPCKN